MFSLKKWALKENFSIISNNPILILEKNNKKCHIKSKIGIITPPISDDFFTNSFLSTQNDLENKDKIEISLNNENKINQVIPIENNPNQTYIKKINYDFSEVLIPIKPILNSTASKTLVKEYSKSNRYREDKAILFSSIEEIKSAKTPENMAEIKKPLEEEPVSEQEPDDLEELLKYQESHLPVPLSKRNNEKFKILKMKQLKRCSIPPNKSAKKFSEDIEPKYEKEFRILNAFSTMKKRKPVHSTRRIYSSNYFLYKKKGVTEKFMVFRDKDIGIYEYWQAHIHETHNDEDVETDEEQKKLASNFSISEVKEGLEYIKNNGDDAFVNFNRYDYLIGKNKAKEIMNSIKANLDNLNLSKTPKRNQ